MKVVNFIHILLSTSSLNLRGLISHRRNRKHKLGDEVCSYTQDVPDQPCDPSFDQVSTKCYMHRKVERRKTTTQNSYSGKFSKTWLVYNPMEKLDHQQISATNHNPSVWSNTWLIAVCLKAHDPSLSEICQKWTSCPNPFPW